MGPRTSGFRPAWPQDGCTVVPPCPQGSCARAAWSGRNLRLTVPSRPRSPGGKAHAGSTSDPHHTVHCLPLVSENVPLSAKGAPSALWRSRLASITTLALCGAILSKTRAT